MIPALLGKKIGMTQVYDEGGVLHPVTVVQAGPCHVLQVKTAETDGYDAVQIGIGAAKAHRSRKPQIGHAAKAGLRPVRTVGEVRLPASDEQLDAGQQLTVELFEGVQYVDVIGVSKGKGTAGPMKRHNFRGQLASHGVERKHRSPGSIGGHATNLGTGPKIKKGKRMAGRLGNNRCTSRNHKLIGIDKDNHLLLIKGPIPGGVGSNVTVRVSKTARVRG
jgi:large subunit ribosomal protein L3